SLEGIRRIDPKTGEALKLSAGSLDVVDHFGFASPETVRWRSRLPSDPPFDNTEIDYELTYTLSGILIHQGSAYRLRHGFPFPDRAGSIEAFSLDLELDPAWQAPAGFARQRKTGRLPPGVSYVVTADLGRTGGAPPLRVRSGTSRTERLALFGILLAAVAGLSLAF